MSKGTAGASLAQRMTRLVFTLATFGDGGQLLGEEGLEGREVGGDALQDEVDLAVEHVALADERPVPALRLEGREVALGLARQADHGEDLDLEAELAGVDPGVVALDQPLLLQRPHPPETGRRRDADPPGQLDVGHPPVGLELGEDLAVDRVELGLGHGRSAGQGV